MLFISWGSKTVFLNLGLDAVHFCTICEKDRSFTTFLRYRVHHIMWLFRWVTGKTYGVACEVCNNGHNLDTAETEAKFDKSPVPLLDRRGWVLGAGAAAALAVGATVAAASQARDTTQYLAEPKVGDIYEVDLAKLSAKPEAPRMYSAVRVVGTTAQDVDVVLPNMYFEAERDMSKKLSSGAANADSFFSAEHTHFSRTALKQMHDDGTIIMVKRNG